MAERWIGRLNGKGRGPLVCAGLAGIVGGAAIGAVPCQYSLELVQHECAWPFPDSVTEGEGVSGTGAICGWWKDCVTTESHAFIWPPDGGLQTIAYPPGFTDMRAFDLNDQGWVVGRMNAVGDPFSYLAFLYADGRVINLGVLPGGLTSEAFDVADDGRIVGYSTANSGSGGHFEACEWQDGTAISLAPLLETAWSTAYAISENGLITGWAGPTFPTSRAFLLDGDQVTFLPLLREAFFSEGRGINVHGNVVGRMVNAKEARAFAWIDRRMIDLGVPSGFTDSYAYAINAINHVVGRIDGLSGARGFIWADNVMTDLNDLIPRDAGITIRSAMAISDDGVITGYGIVPGGDIMAVRLLPAAIRSGDLDGDGIVNGIDIAMLLADWGECRSGCLCAADLNGDQVINGFDLAHLLSHWGPA